MGNLSSTAPRIGAPRAAATASPQLQNNACERLPREGARSFDYACDYIKMGPGRSIEKVAKKFGKKARPLKKYSRKWQWVKRAAAYDRSMESQNLEEAAAFAKAEAQKWAQRARDQRERQLMLDDRLIEELETVIKLPLIEVKWVTKVDAGGREIQMQIIKPIVALREAVLYSKTGFALTGQAIWYKSATHSDVAEVDFDECSAQPIAAGQKTAWAHRPREGTRAYQYAWEYVRMGPDRSIEKVAQKFGKNKRPLKRYSRKWEWVKRAAAYDRSIEAQKMEASEAFTKAEQQKSAQRQRDQRERLFLLGERYIERGSTILKFPLTEVTRVTQVDADGRPTQIQIIKPVRWAKRDALLFSSSGQVMTAAAIRNERWPCSPKRRAAPRSVRHSSQT